VGPAKTSQTCATALPTPRASGLVDDGRLQPSGVRMCCIPEAKTPVFRTGVFVLPGVQLPVTVSDPTMKSCSVQWNG